MADDVYPLPPPLPPPNLASILEHHLATSLPPDLAFDLVLNELVVRAADATHASSAALALLRGNEMVCRAATGSNAPGLGVPLDTRDGLTGACVRTHMPQLCTDAEIDPRVDSDALQRMGIRSMLVVPVFDRKPIDDQKPFDQRPFDQRSSDQRSPDQRPTGDESEGPDGITASCPEPELVGVIEILSSYPNAFSPASQSLLEEFAREVSNVRQAADKLLDRTAAASPLEPELLKSFDSTTNVPAEDIPPVRSRYEMQTLILGALVIFAAIGVSFMVGSRVGWLRSAETFVPPAPVAPVSAAPIPASPPAQSPVADSGDAARTKAAKPKAKPAAAASENPPAPSSGELVVYDKGKVIFRMKQPTAQSAASPGNTPITATRSAQAAPVGSSVVPASSNARLGAPRAAWLAPNEAEDRLLNRVEPQYPPEALAAHHSGSVVLEVNVAEDGTVSSVHTLIGDPLLAAAAAQAVRSWRYQPYRSHDQPSPFQTDVTLTFSLPN
ncbi:MAG: TonB family protein [Terriglobales bacterium]|jgi:protein TonB